MDNTKTFIAIKYPVHMLCCFTISLVGLGQGRVERLFTCVILHNVVSACPKSGDCHSVVGVVFCLLLLFFFFTLIRSLRFSFEFCITFFIFGPFIDDKSAESILLIVECSSMIFTFAVVFFVLCNLVFG